MAQAHQGASSLMVQLPVREGAVEGPTAVVTGSSPEGTRLTGSPFVSLNEPLRGQAKQSPITRPGWGTTGSQQAPPMWAR